MSKAALGARFYEEVEWVPTPIHAERHDGSGLVSPADSTGGKGPFLIPSLYDVYKDGRKVRRARVYRILVDVYVRGSGGPATGGVTKGVIIPAGSYIKCTRAGDAYTLATLRFWR